MTRVLSLGAGVQSSALLLMAEAGRYPRPDFAVFADPQGETPDTYAWLEKLKRLSSIPIYQPTFGNLYDDELNSVKRSTLPYWTSSPDGKPTGISMRKCTADYKIRLVYKEIRRVLGLKGKRLPVGEIKVMIGISVDEAQRMKPSREPWVENEHPLCFDRITRQNCKDYVESVAGEVPPRSACFFCPFHSNLEWRRIRDGFPDLWYLATALDRRARERFGYNAKLFLHRDRVALEDADLGGKDQVDLFGNECEGMCGV
jgi:hypothetical protein